MVRTAENSLPGVVLATPSWSLNGPNVFSANLVRGLNELRIPAHIVVTRPDWIDAKPLPRPPDVPFKTLPVGRFASFAARCGSMIQYLKEHAPCIYIPNYDFNHSCVSPMLPDSVSVIGIIHSDDSQHYEHARRLGRYWNSVVAVSSVIGTEILKLDPSLAPRLSVIPYGVTASERPAERSFAIDQPLRIIYTGRLDQAQKRVLDLPGIVEAASQRGVPVHMSIAGSGPAESELRRRFAETGVRVDFLGTLDSGALADVLARHDVFLLVSAFEGLPISVLEAMGQGCIPVVSDLRSGIPELIEDGRNGFRVAMGDVQRFSDCLVQLFHTSGMRRRMSEAARATASSAPYRMEYMVGSYVELFARIRYEAARGGFRRPSGPTLPPPGLPWQEHLPGTLQRVGHYARQLATGSR